MTISTKKQRTKKMYEGVGISFDRNNINNQRSNLIVGSGEINVYGTTTYFKGLQGGGYFGANYTDNTYVQKKYVDDLFTVPVSATQSGIVNNISLQELGGVDKLINGVRIGRGKLGDEDSVVLGLGSLESTTTGKANTAVGSYVLSSTTTGGNNTGLGDGALYLNTTGIYNSAIGTSSLQNNTTGEKNVGVGASLYYNSTGSRNTGVGFNAGYGATTGSFNTYIGNQSGYNNGVGNYNVAVGNCALITSGAGTTASTLNMSNNVFIGSRLIAADGMNNILAIDNKGATNTPAVDSLIYGSFATRFARINGQLQVKNRLRFDAEVGEEKAGDLFFNNITYSYSFGDLNEVATGIFNSSFGYNSLSKVTTGANNSTYGAYVLPNLTSGSFNAGLGNSAGYSITTGLRNSLFGWSAMNKGNGSLNSVFGHNAGGGSVANYGDRNIILGANAGSNGQGTNNILIGVGAGNGENLTNKLVIHSNTSLSGYSNTSEGIFSSISQSRLANALITGDFSEKWVKLNGKLIVNPTFLEAADSNFTKNIVAKADGTFGVEARISVPTPPTTGTFTLQSVDGVMSWV